MQLLVIVKTLKLQTEITPGNHTIYLKIDWCRSNKLEFNIHGNKTIEFECGPSIKSLNILCGLIYITFMRNKYLWIKKK